MKEEVVNLKDDVISKQPTSLALTEHARASFFVTVSNDVTKEMLLKPEFWAHVTGRLSPGSHIEVVPQNRKYFAELFVLAKARNWAKVRLLHFVTLVEDPSDIIDENFRIEFVDSTNVWRVLRGDDILSEGHEDKEEAVKWLQEHKKEIL